MAKAYLGKISALVTANTSDFNAKLNASAKEVRSFAASMQSSISRAESNATTSLRGIYTEAQKLERALKAASSLRLSFKGIDTSKFKDVGAAADQLRRVASAAQLIYKPLQTAAKATESLSNEVRGAFQPALVRAQSQAELLSTALTRGMAVSEKSFAAVENRVNMTAAAIGRLREASDLAASGPRGTELAFVDPRARDALTRSASIRKDAANAPASVIESSNIGDQVKRLVQIDALIEKTRAELESALVLNIDSTQAQAKLNGLIDQSNRLYDTLSEGINGTPAEIEAKKLKDAMVAIGQTNAPSKPIDELEKNLREAQAEVAKLDGAMKAAGERNIERIKSFVAKNAGNEDAAALAARKAGEVRDEASAASEGKRRKPSDFAPPLPPGFGGSSDAGLGAPLDAASRQLEQFRSGIVSAKSQLDSMPASVRTQFIPAIQDAEQEFRRLAALGPSATVEEIEAASAALGRLQSAANNASKFTKSLSESFDDSRVRSFSARLEALRGVLINAGAAAGTEAATRFETLRQAILRAAASGDFNAVIGELNRLEKEAIDAGAAFAGLSSKDVAARLQRAGDIGRGGVDKFSLALNQAAFAIDDFFSSTGGVEFKLRAVSNNITQLGFIVGGTSGLFVSLGAVIAGQVGVAIAKFVFETDKADAALTALNAALEANQRNVEQLAESYRRLADEIAKATLSPRDNLRRDRNRQRDEIVKQRQAAEEEAFASASPEVSRVRGERELLKKKQQESNSIEERVRIAKQIKENLKREQELLANRGAGEADAVVSEAADREVAAQRVRLNRARLRRTLGIPARAGEGVAELEDVVARAEERRAAVRARRLPGATSASQTRVQLTELQQSLQSAEQARAELVNALPAMAPGDRVTAVDELDQTIERLKDRIDVVSAVLGGQLASELIDANFRIQDALSSAAESLSSLGIESALSDQRDRLSRELTAIADEIASISDPARAEELRKQQEELERQSAALRSAASSVERFAAVIDRVAKQLSDTVLQDVEGRAGQARREANAARGAVDAGVANVPAFNRPRVASDQRRRQDEAEADRRRLEADVQRAQSGQQEFERRRRQAVQRFESRAAGGTLGQEAQQLIQERDKAQAVLDSDTATVKERQQAADTLARVNARLDQLFQNSTLGRALADFADGLDAASQAAAELDRQIREQRASADRGRELTLTPGERAAEELNQQIADIREYATRAVEESSGLPEDVAKIRGRMNDAIQRAEEAMIRQVAPTITGMADAVRNSVALGPSRAALTASDATTTQGQQELNRLLRGDDANKNADLVSLQREANELLRAIERKENPVAV